jgi:hypothetical protein
MDYLAHLATKGGGIANSAQQATHELDAAMRFRLAALEFSRDQALADVKASYRTMETIAERFHASEARVRELEGACEAFTEDDVSCLHHVGLDRRQPQLLELAITVARCRAAVGRDGE